MKIDEINAGMSAELARTVTSEDIVRFAEVTGDMNPVHLDDEAARQSPFRERIAHVRTKLAGYKAPKRIVFLDALPRLGSGKIDRAALAARATSTAREGIAR